MDILATALEQESSQMAVTEKRDLLARLLARLAHEIRNPLSSLDVHVQLLEEDLGALSPEIREQTSARLAIIHGELHRLESIVSQFLRLTGPSDLDLESVSLPKIVAHVCELLRPEAAARAIELVTSLEEPLAQVMADPVRLTQALVNLVINAMQAIERNGRICVRVTTSEGLVWLEVADSGPGLPSEKLGSIFDPYFTTKEEGHGLGLWIAQQIVAAHGGRITAQNGAQGGALLRMALPSERAGAG